MFKYRFIQRISSRVLLAGPTMNVNTLPINFKANLDVIEVDSGGAVYSG